MNGLQFAWNPRKAKENTQKHGVTFEEAQSVFLDDQALFQADPEHSLEEDRFLLLGVSSKLRTLVVCHCFREADDVIRIISARKATKLERRQYEERARR